MNEDCLDTDFSKKKREKRKKLTCGRVTDYSKIERDPKNLDSLMPLM